jgi:hypothetical protein
MGMAKGCGFTLTFNRRPVEYIYFEVHGDHLIHGKIDRARQLQREAIARARSLP